MSANKITETISKYKKEKNHESEIGEESSKTTKIGDARVGNATTDSKNKSVDTENNKDHDCSINLLIGELSANSRCDDFNSEELVMWMTKSNHWNIIVW